MRMFLVALSSLMLCACAGTGTPESGAATPMPQMTNPKVFTEADSAACTEAGGLYERAGRMQWYRCTVTFDDAGKTCSDAADCQGRCMAGEGSMSDVATAGPVSGTCAATDRPFGCYTTITDGKPDSTICVD